MSNLLLLADVAWPDASKSSSPLFVNVSVQTDQLVSDTGYSDVSVQTENANVPAFDASMYMFAGGHNLFELPNLPPSHDYVKQTDVDFFVNTTHDYFRRLAPPVDDLEHSYAFPTADAFVSSADNILTDDGCFEAIPNLDEYMGISADADHHSSVTVQQIFEEIVHHDDVDHVNADDPFDRLSVGSLDAQTVGQFDKVNFDELIGYINPSEAESPMPSKTDVRMTSSKKRCVDQNERIEQQSDLSAEPAVFSVCEWFGCKQSVQDILSLGAHILNSHLQDRPACSWTCMWRDCSRQTEFAHRYQLLRHLRLHTREAPYICTACNNRFRSRELLNVHLRRKHGHEKRYVCKTCEKPFASTGDLSRHNRVHKTASADFMCKICSLTYKDESGLRKHKRRVHPPEP